MISPTLSQEVTTLHAELCSALADPKRILMLYALSEKPCTVNELAEALGLNQPTTSRHLGMLRERGLVLAQREGQTVINTLADPRVIQALDLLRAVLNSKLKNQAALVEIQIPPQEDSQPTGEL